MDGLLLLGAGSPPKHPMPWSRSVLAIGAGVLGALLFRKHPVLAFIGTSAVASNAHALYQRDRSYKEAIQRVGQHVVAIAGALALPKHPVVGYVAGLVAADVLIDGEGGGIIEEWAEYGGLDRHRHNKDIIDAEVIDVQPVKT